MGYDLCWGLRRERGLDDREIERLRVHVDEVAEGITNYNLSVAPTLERGWIALGTLRPRRDDIDAVRDDVFDAMTELRTVIGDAQLFIRDDYAEYVWKNGDWDADTESETDIPLPPTSWLRLEHAVPDDEDDDDGDDDANDTPRERPIYELKGQTLADVFGDPEQSEERRLQALDRLILDAKDHSRLTLGVIARVRDEQPAHMARVMAKLGEYSTIRALPTVLLAIDRGIAHTTLAWAQLSSRQVDRIVPWLPATAAGRALVWLHTPKEPDLVPYVRARGGHPSDIVFEAWGQLDHVHTREQAAGGRGIFDDFEPYANQTVVAAIDALLAAIERYEREYGPVISVASAGANELVRYHQTRAGKPPVALIAVARDLAVALAVTLGAESQPGFLTERAKQELLAYEMTMGVPTLAEVEAGERGAG